MTYQHPNDPWQPPPAYGMVPPQVDPTMAFPPVPPPTSWWHRLSTVAQVSLIVVPLVVLCCGGSAIIAAVAGSSGHAAASGSADATGGSPASTHEAAGLVVPSSSATATAVPQGPAPTPSATPVVQTRTVTETRSIPYQTKRVNDPNRASGTTATRTRGVNGVKTLTYQVTVTNGVQTAKKLVKQQTTKAPVTKIIAVGTKHTQKCDPNYSGACVPIASDVDCAGGSGNGPAYVQGPVTVIGTDIYDLDRDGDGIGCD